MLGNLKCCKFEVVVDAIHHSFHLYTLRKQVVEVNFIVNVSIVKNIFSHGSTQLTGRTVLLKVLGMCMLKKHAGGEKVWVPGQLDDNFV